MVRFSSGRVKRGSICDACGSCGESARFHARLLWTDDGGAESSGRCPGRTGSTDRRLHSPGLEYAFPLHERMQECGRPEGEDRAGDVSSLWHGDAGSRQRDAGGVPRGGAAPAASHSSSGRSDAAGTAGGGLALPAQPVRRAGRALQRDVRVGQLLHRARIGARRPDRPCAGHGGELLF